MLSREPYEGCAFPVVRRVTFGIVLGNNIRAKPSVAVANIAAFVQRVNEMAPKVKCFILSPKSSKVYSHSTGHYLDDLVTQLFQLVKQAVFERPEAFLSFQELRLDGVCNLASIRHSTQYRSNVFELLIRRNASTLESLDIVATITENAPSIIQDASGASVSYPRLNTLCLRHCATESDVPLPVFKNAVPFPILRCLSVLCAYPFGDDVLFRGNSATLERLTMVLETPTAVMLRRHRVFTAESHQRLQRVDVRCSEDLVPDTFTTAAEALQFISGIGRRASVRETSLVMVGPNLEWIPMSVGNYACVQVLTLPCVKLSIWGTIELIKSLPLLADLGSMLPDSGPLRCSSAVDSLLEHTILAQCPMGLRFRRWRLFDSEDEIVTENSLKRVLALAVACPNFWCATTQFTKGEQLSQMAEKVVALEIFKPYALRLQRFRFLN
ncbi:hypothetical protein GGI10_000327 [Coemansia sp. RSA 2530]|nr:hypothetical protein GGI10_000327 [Coemansia sp. RSA 2530]